MLVHLRVLLFAIVFLLVGCTDRNGHSKNDIKKPYGDSFKMASHETQVKVEKLLRESGVKFHKGENGYITYTLYDHHHVLSIVRKCQGDNSDQYAIESIPPKNQEHKAMLVSGLKKQGLWFDVGTGPDGKEIISWRKYDGFEVDLLRRNVRLKLLGITPPSVINGDVPH